LLQLRRFIPEHRLRDAFDNGSSLGKGLHGLAML
jgi:hypothetical protein